MPILQRRLVTALALTLALAATAHAKPPSLKPFEQDGKWGYKDAKGKVVIPPRFGIAGDFGKNAVACVAEEKGFAWINAKGEVVARAFVFDNDCDPVAQGLSRIVDGGKHGFIDMQGRIVIPPRFDFVKPFEKGRAAFCTGCKSVKDGEHTRIEGGLWGAVDRTGKEVVPATQKR